MITRVITKSGKDYHIVDNKHCSIKEIIDNDSHVKVVTKFNTVIMIWAHAVESIEIKIG